MIKKDIYRISANLALKHGSATLVLTDKVIMYVSCEQDCVLGWSRQHRAFMSKGKAITIYSTLFENGEVKRRYAFQKSSCDNTYTTQRFINTTDVNRTNPFFKEVANSYEFTKYSIESETRKAIKKLSKSLN